MKLYKIFIALAATWITGSMIMASEVEREKERLEAEIKQLWKRQQECNDLIINFTRGREITENNLHTLLSKPQEAILSQRVHEQNIERFTKEIDSEIKRLQELQQELKDIPTQISAKEHQLNILLQDEEAERENPTNIWINRWLNPDPAHNWKKYVHLGTGFLPATSFNLDIINALIEAYNRATVPEIQTTIRKALEEISNQQNNWIGRLRAYGVVPEPRYEAENKIVTNFLRKANGAQGSAGGVAASSGPRIPVFDPSNPFSGSRSGSSSQASYNPASSGAQASSVARGGVAASSGPAIPASNSRSPSSGSQSGSFSQASYSQPARSSLDPDATTTETWVDRWLDPNPATNWTHHILTIHAFRPSVIDALIKQYNASTDRERKRIELILRNIWQQRYAFKIQLLENQTQLSEQDRQDLNDDTINAFLGKPTREDLNRR